MPNEKANKILIVDDEVELAEAICEGLSSKYETFTADSAEEGLSFLESKKVDCVILDIRMPGMDGLEALKKINATYPSLPVIMATGDGDEKTAVDALRFGATGYLKKPMKLEEIFQEIERSITDTQKKRGDFSSTEVLLVDDEKLILKTLSKGLGSQPYQLRTANSAAGALDEIRKKPIDILVTDVKMPGQDGFSLIEEARGIQEDFLSIVITGSGNYEGAIESIKSGVFDYISKPVQPKELNETIKRGLKQNADMQKLRQKNELLTKKEETIRRINADLVAQRNHAELQKKYIDTIIQSMTNMLIVTDVKGRIRVINRVASGILGFEERELLEAPIRMIFRKFQQVIGVLQNGSSLMNENYSFEAKDGGEVPVVVSATRIVNPHDGCDNFVFVAQDMTNYRKLQESLQQSQKMEAIGQLAGGVAHDFNNILTIIMGSLEMARPLVENADAQKKIQLANESAERAAVLTRQLLTFSRKQTFQVTSVDLNDLVQRMHVMLKPLIGEKIEVNTVLQKGLKSVNCDSSQLEQIIMNLVVNARDAMPNGGKITIETQAITLDNTYRNYLDNIGDGKYILLSVSDNGMGMEASVRARIFEPFFTTKRRGSGTGLGLSTVYGAVKQMNGHIWVYSELDFGTTFKICLPAKEQKTDSKKESEIVDKNLLVGNETILLVEDEVDILTIAKESLKQYGYQVLEATDPLEAMKLINKVNGEIDLIIADVVMPRMNGDELVDLAQAKHPKIKALFMSGYPDGAIAHHGNLKDNINFLQKPFLPRDLLILLRSILDGTEKPPI